MSIQTPETFDLVYRIEATRPETHLFEVAIEIHVASLRPLRLRMPAWTPGSYTIRDFARQLSGLGAVDGAGRRIDTTKLDKQTWELDLGGDEPLPIVLSYRIFAWELSVRTAHLDRTHAYFNGAPLLLSAEGMERRPCRLDLLRPKGDAYADWRVSTSLLPYQVDPAGFGAYRAENYEDLIDHPVEMGHFDLLGFEVGSVPHRMTISGRHRADSDRLTQDLMRLCAQHAALFGELPIDRYLFQVMALGEGYGGLEHRYSASLLCSRDDLPYPGEGSPSEGYRRFLGLCSHEYFHLWHVKRIRPQALQEASLAVEAHTRLLWAFEGITSYYDELALVRCGCIDTRAYLQLLAETLTRVQRTPGRQVQTLAESSFDAWTKLYKADENAPNAIISYYTKGALVALALDLTLRQDTLGRVSLDRVMRELWVRYGRTGIGVPERGIEALAMEVSGLDLSGFFAKALDSTEDLDLAGLLESVGIASRLRPQRGAKDLGGCVADFEPIGAEPTLAVRLRVGSSEAGIQHVLTGGAGERAGLAPGDRIIAVDGLRATADNLERLVARAAANGPVRLHVFRRDELLELLAEPQAAVADTWELMPLAAVPESVARARAAWLSAGE